jgi:hypothetical protein
LAEARRLSAPYPTGVSPIIQAAPGKRPGAASFCTVAPRARTFFRSVLMSTKTFLPRAVCAGLFAALAAGAPLRADEWMKFGLGLHIASPSEDLANEKEMVVAAKTGFGFSAFAEMGLTPKMALRGRLDYNVFGEGTNTNIAGLPASVSAKLNASAMTVFADFIYSFDSHEKGFYAFGGLGLVAGELDYDFKISPINVPINASGSSIGVSLGCGYSFNKNMGLELSFVSASGVINEMKMDGETTTLEDKDKIGFDYMQVSFKYRF